jgi:hypothetical protein
MSFDAATVTPLGGLALSGGAALGGAWAGMRRRPRRVLLIAAIWVTTTLLLWALTVSQNDMARSYWLELLRFHAIASLAPAGLAFVLARSVTGSTRKLSVAGGIVLVLLVWSGLAMVSLLVSACLLDVRCY